MTARLLDTHEDTEGVELFPNFARHETFHPRFGWLKKAFDAALNDPAIFHADDATTRLGVGKNMVRAIRYWSLAYKIVEERPNPDRPRLSDAHPTSFGHELLGEDGWDPFLEDPASLWLLHWKLLRSPCRAPAWFAIFNRFRGGEFTDETLASQLQFYCESHPEWGEVAQNSLLKDARCLLRMYASVTSGRDLLEDTIDSPFVDLDLIRVLQGTRRYFTLNTGFKPSLSAEVLAYACVDFAIAQNTSARLLTLSRLTHAPGSPGRAFQITEETLGALLEDFIESNGQLQLTQAAGTRQLIVDEASYERPQSILAAHFDRGRVRRRRRVRAIR